MNYVVAWESHACDIVSRREHLRLVKAGKTRWERGAFRWLQVMREKGFFAEDGKIAEMGYGLKNKRKKG